MSVPIQSVICELFIEYDIICVLHQQYMLTRTLVPFLSSVFVHALAFNQPLENWDVSKVTQMKNMFIGASRFNQPIGDWDVSGVTSMTGSKYA